MYVASPRGEPLEQEPIPKLGESVVPKPLPLPPGAEIPMPGQVKALDLRSAPYGA